MSNLSLKYQKDYKNAEYSNPRLTRDREKRSRRWRGFCLTIFMAVITGLIYLLFFSPLFEIKEVSINGLEKIKSDSIAKILSEYRGERRWLFLSNNNFWLFDAAAVESRLGQKYFFEKLEIKKKFPAAVTISLEEKISAVNWLTNNFCYHLDMTGMVIEYCDSATQNMTIKDGANRAAEIGQPAITREELVYLVEISDQFGMRTKNQFRTKQIEKFGNLFDFIQETGPILRFNYNLTAAEQIQRLGSLLEQPDFVASMSDMKYIDLRFGEKVYYQ